MRLFKQKNIPWLGAIVDSLYTSLPLLSIINFLSITTVLYATLKEYLLHWAPWLTFGMFIGFLSLLTILMMVIMYLFILPSIWTFRDKQMYGFESVLMKEIQTLKEEIQKIRSSEIENTLIEVASIPTNVYKEVIEIRVPVRFYWNEEGFDGIEFGEFRTVLQPWEEDMVNRCLDAAGEEEKK